MPRVALSRVRVLRPTDPCCPGQRGGPSRHAVARRSWREWSWGHDLRHSENVTAEDVRRQRLFRGSMVALIVVVMLGLLVLIEALRDGYTSEDDAEVALGVLGLLSGVLLAALTVWLWHVNETPDTRDGDQTLAGARPVDAAQAAANDAGNTAQLSPAQSAPQPSAHTDAATADLRSRIQVPALEIGDGGHFFSRDWAAAVDYVSALLDLPSRDRVVHVRFPTLNPTERAKIAGQVAEFKRVATRLVQGDIKLLASADPPQLAEGLYSLWAAFGNEPLVARWWAWPPGRPDLVVPFTVPIGPPEQPTEWDRRQIRILDSRPSLQQLREQADLQAEQFPADRPLHIRRFAPQLVATRLAPLALKAALANRDEYGGLPLDLSDWRVSDHDPRDNAHFQTLDPLPG